MGGRIWGKVVSIDRARLLKSGVAIRLATMKQLQVTVQDADGNPIKGANVNLTLWLGRTGEGSGSGFTDSTGSTTITRLMEGGTYTASVSCDGYNQYSDQFPGATVDSKWTGVKAITLTRSGMAKGKVVDAQGNPLEGVDVRMSENGQSRARTKADGSFSVYMPAADEGLSEPGIPPGHVFLKAEDTGRGLGAYVHVDRKELMTQGVTITLKPAHTLSVVVRDTSGNPLKGVEVEVFPEGYQGGARVLYTDGNGVTTQPNLYDGLTYAILTKIEGYYRGTYGHDTPVAGTKEWSDRVELTMEPCTRTQTGIVVDQAGEPVADALIGVSSNDSLTAKTGADGKFTLKGLPDSQVYIMVNSGSLRGNAQVSKSTPNVTITVK